MIIIGEFIRGEINKKCSVIICTRNRPDEIKRLFTSLTRQTVLPNEVILVDASDNPEELASIRNGKQFRSLNIIYKHIAPGLTRQRNVGISLSSGDILFFFDDDVVLMPKYIENIMQVYMDKNLDNIGGAQGIDLNKKNSFLASKRKLWFYRIFSLARRDKYAKVLRSGNSVHLDFASPDIQCTNTPIRTYCMSGCSMSFLRKVFETFLFDENYQGYSFGEDSDFSFRVSKKYKIYFTSLAKFYHAQTAERKDWCRTEDFRRKSIKCQVYLFRKHMRSNPLNYFVILWSWLGMLLWNGIIYPNKTSFIYCIKAMKDEIFNLLKPVIMREREM